MTQASPYPDPDRRQPVEAPSVEALPPVRSPMQRRAWQRVATNHPVLLGGPTGDFSAQAVDLSRGGVLVAVHDPMLVGEGQDVAERVALHFPEGLEVRFVESEISRHAFVARTLVSPGVTLGIGCAFDAPLTTREALILGVVAGETHVPEVRLDQLPFEPRPATPLTLVLEDQVAGLSGPFAIGPVVAAGEYVVEAHFPQTVNSLAASCGDGPVHGAVVLGPERLWEAPAKLVLCEHRGTSGTRARLLFDGTFDHRLAGRLRRQTS